MRGVREDRNGGMRERCEGEGRLREGEEVWQEEREV